MDVILRMIVALALFLVVLVALGLLLGYPVMWMMNYLFAPGALMAVFGIPQMTFWKAFWFGVVVGALVKSIS